MERVMTNKYLVSYHWIKNKPAGIEGGFGRCVIVSNTAISSLEEIVDIEKRISSENGTDSVAILFFTRLEKE